MPIRVAFSPLSQKFYAFDRWKSEIRDGKEILTVLGEKYDVTQDIANAVVSNEITFTPKEEE